MSTEVIFEEVKTYKVLCQYRERGEVEFSSKAYTFGAYEPHIPGELVVVKDRYGYSLVKVVSCVPDGALGGTCYIIDINEVNEVAKLAYKKEQVQSTIREALIKDIEKNAFERLAASHPELKETLEEFKQLGGSYTELMPSIKNLIGDKMILKYTLKRLWLVYTTRLAIDFERKLLKCMSLLLTAQMLFALESEHHEAVRVISEEMEVQRASWYMKEYRKCLTNN